ncbi:MAG: hypothetical protein AVDCRST_MAG73-2395 [uncultured Thermomicrobiales bacterium]|uniref:Uncharacterized protein n=1 Tax=uncultured Thermomicrobiales bacterium TaxID=1645740 RepID=A0A6J4UB96_9BACT|nr:MAG: hypothetical protein AVDCRST_MAG73-2395 [uncultured Thermomicrobiales bacterium]
MVARAAIALLGWDGGIVALPGGSGFGCGRPQRIAAGPTTPVA